MRSYEKLLIDLLWAMETIGEHTLGHSHAPARARTRRPSEEEREREKEEQMGVKRMIGFIAVVLPLMLWMSSLCDRVLDEGV